MIDLFAFGLAMGAAFALGRQFPDHNIRKGLQALVRSQKGLLATQDELIDSQRNLINTLRDSRDFYRKYYREDHES
jgi:hypothetical protein